MKYKITIVICLLGLQLGWCQEDEKTVPEEKQEQGETQHEPKIPEGDEEERKKKFIEEQAALYIAFYKSELESVNARIAEMNGLVADPEQDKSVVDKAMQSLPMLIKQRNGLNAKIEKLEENPEESDFTEQEGQKLTRKQKKQQQEQEDAEKKAELHQKAAPFILIYEAELESLNANIEELNKLLADGTQSKETSDKALQSIAEFVKQRNELKAKIDKLKTNPEEEDFTEEKQNKINLKEARYTFLNGVNFDFNNSETNYVGHFNIYVPSAKKSDGKLNPWGINVGILKVNYMERDSIVNFSTDNVLINPLDTPNSDGELYNRQYNRYSTSTKVTSTSFYAQPMYRLGKQGAANFYVHGHFELLWSKIETATRIRNVQTEEVTISEDSPAPESFITALEAETKHSINIESPHFGGGITVDFNFKDDCILFLQPTIGVGFNTIDRYPTKDADGNYTLQTYSKPQGFFLVRTYFEYNTSKATQIVIGTDIRGLLPNQPPYVSAYAGINLGIDKIFE
jgi:hypothetical protein